LVEQGKQRREILPVVTIIDPTVCYQCKADNGYQEFPLVGNLPFCPKCVTALRERPFPVWLRLALAGLLVLLGFALVHGAPFFKAGRALVIGERLVAARRYPEAILRLQEALATAPGCEKGVLLLAKAELLTGRFVEAQKALVGHRGGQYKEGPLATEVKKLYERAGKSLEKADLARKLYEQKKWDEAARSMREAATLYPELPFLAATADSLDATGAFERRDYDGFLEIAQRAWKNHPDSSEFAGMLASALACKYAVTGEQAFRTRSEEMLARARQLAASSPQAKERQQDLEERTRYRLESRQIIDIDEYNRRFRPKSTGP
jgi:tetratricopeptide (TPR) repeat protein